MKTIEYSCVLLLFDRKQQEETRSNNIYIDDEKEYQLVIMSMNVIERICSCC
jgi:hypothetical protein